MQSIKTTAIGGLIIIGCAILVLAAMLSEEGIESANWELIGGGVMIALGFFSARDNDVTSEEAGATTAAAKRGSLPDSSTTPSKRSGPSAPALILVIVPAFLLASCSVPSLNMQRALLRSGGDVGATALLEKVEAVNAGQLEGVAQNVLTFLDSGSVADLKIKDATAQILALIPAQFIEWAERLIAIIDKREEDLVGLLGVNNVKRLKAFVKGFLRGVQEYEP